MKAEELDRMFDESEDLATELDVPPTRKNGREPGRVTVDFPAWMLDALDREAKRLGVTRQSVVKVWIAERLEQKTS